MGRRARSLCAGEESGEILGAHRSGFILSPATILTLLMEKYLTFLKAKWKYAFFEG